MSDFNTWNDFISSTEVDWNRETLGDLFSNRQEKGRDDLPLLSVTGSFGVIDRDQLERRDTSNNDKGKYLRVAAGDIVYNTMRMWQGVSGSASKEGIVSPAYTVITPEISIDRTYAKYLVKNPLLIQMFHRNSQGMVNDTLNLKFPNFASISVKVPPLPEQKKIAAILTFVDEVIDATQKQIDKLQDLKKATMNELLTKGIGHTEFKDSELGRIPKSWEVRALEEVVNPNRPITYGIVQTGENISDGVPCVRVVDIAKNVPVPAQMIKTSKEISNAYKRTILVKGDIMFALRGEIGHVVEVSEELQGCNLTRGIALISLSKTIKSEYLLWALRSTPVRREIFDGVNGSALQEIPLGNLRKVHIPVPPFSEQISIFEAMNSIESCISFASTKLKSFISLKKSLMQDLLTGKVRVKVD